MSAGLYKQSFDPLVTYRETHPPGHATIADIFLGFLIAAAVLFGQLAQITAYKSFRNLSIQLDL